VASAERVPSEPQLERQIALEERDPHIQSEVGSGARDDARSRPEIIRAAQIKVD